MAWTERYVSVAGGGAHDGTSEANAWTLAEAIAAYASGQRVNVKAGTYASTTTNRTFATAGTTTAPVWWRGYTTTIGDLDTQPTTTRVAGTDIPDFTFTTGAFSATGAHQIFSDIAISNSGSTGAIATAGAANQTFVRCRFSATNTASGVRAMNAATGQHRFVACYFGATTTSARVVDNAAEGTYVGCVFEGGGTHIQISAGTAVIMGCVFDDPGTHGIELSVAPSRPLVILNNTIYSAGTDGIRLGALPSHGVIANNLITNSGGWGINNSTGTNTNVVTRFGNDFRSNSSGNETGFGDSPSLYELSEASDPYTNAGADDFSLVTGASAKAGGVPGLFDNETYRSYLDVGAVQRQEAGGGGTTIAGTPMLRGMC